eukprot:CAMPEP_0206266184 /NCGR_PEP_ID=MMETSP0047_2-20121206/30427_1 /ASSEMBLY_ACC=CAM_ASM_000192 /TAXON_ID=195065 /ORGANISM="Chroomonas mesostigmatica_cf, Strain CCMP1168" /LENGTH=196 /DNA_ID=CAMNT_0053694197 /DNA_START=175 /DNA_END=760 /DNA_ORIENTATION=+
MVAAGPAKALELELQRAAKAGDCKAVRQLVRRGARLNAQDVDGWTALHAAAAEGRLSSVELLLSHADVIDANVATLDGRTPLYLAALEGSLECVRALLAHGADPHAATPEGRGPRDVAVLFGHGEVVSELEAAAEAPPTRRKPVAESVLKGGGKKDEAEQALRSKAEEYASRKPQEWKKSDFTKWNQMRDSDWEGL